MISKISFITRSVRQNLIRAILPGFFGTFLLMQRNIGLIGPRLYESDTILNFVQNSLVIALLMFILLWLATMVVIIVFNLLADLVIRRLKW
ncbi:MAG: hypothetical protein OHK0017_12000 [Patescibacteria group bacterium]